MRWLVLVCLVTAACRVDTRSDKLRCSVQTDCSGGRTCQAGYCIAVDAHVVDAHVDARGDGGGGGGGGGNGSQ